MRALSLSQTGYQQMASVVWTSRQGPGEAGRSHALSTPAGSAVRPNSRLEPLLSRWDNPALLFGGAPAPHIP